MKQSTTIAKRILLLLCAVFLSTSSFAQLKISQVYGGGGNSGATYNRDFVEIFNPTASAVTVTNWAIQQASAAGSSWAVQPFTATIPAGKYFLISLASGANGVALPTADVVGSTSINIGTTGKIYLTNTTTLLVGTCPSGATVVDYVGFGGTASCYETAPYSGTAPGNTTSLTRANGGCTDANNNNTDFVVLSVNPRNSASATNSCVTPPTATTNAATVTTTTDATLNGTVNANGTSTGVTFEYGLTISYGSTIAGTPSPVTGSSATSVSASVSSLAVNTQYNYRIVAVGAGTTNGSNVTFYTFANVPSAPTVGNPSTSTLDVSITGGDGNPSTTEYAIQETGSTNYVQSGGALGASAAWQTASAWGTKTITGLASSTSYTFQVKARNGAAVETAFSGTTSGTTSASGSPTIAVVGTTTPFSTVVGTPSASQSYFVSGTSLTNDIAVKPPVDFQVSTDNSTWISNPSSITLTQASGIVASTQIYVRFNPALAGVYSTAVSHESTGASTIPLSVTGTALALEPTTASTVSFGTTSATAMTINFSGGSGASRIVVVRAGSAVGFVPTDGVAATGVNADFSLATNQGSGDKIVYDGNLNTVNVIGLTAATNYFVAVYEYNGTATTINYYSTAGTGNNSTIIAEPTVASTLTFGTVGTTSMVLNFTGGNGASRIVVARHAAAVSFTPTDLTSYSGVNNDFTLAADQGSGNKIVYDGIGTTVTVNGLSQGEQYFYVVYEYNGLGVTSNYLITPNGSNSTSTVGPWPYGVTASTYTQDFNTLPTTGTFTITVPSYISTTPINASGMGGWQIGGVLGTPKLTTSDGTGATPSGSAYNTGVTSSTERSLGALASGSTIADLGIVFKNTTTDVLTNVTITFVGEQWRRGSGAANVLAFKYSVGGSDLATGTFTPEPSLNFTSPVVAGTDVALNGNVAPNRTAVSASFALNANWMPGQTLVVRWDDANDGGNDDMLSIDDFTFVATGPTTPTSQDNNISFSSVLTTSMITSWINGDGINHLVKINTTNSFTDPVDGNSYSANSVYAGSGEQVVYDGTNNTVNLSGLSAGTQYWVRAYGYNGSGTGSKYLTTTATLNPNTQTTATPALATQIVITSINGGVNPKQNTPFYVVVQSQDGSSSPQNVVANTAFDFTVYSGLGNLSGTISGLIPAGQSTDTVFGVIYDIADFGVQLDVTVSSGDPLANTQSALFDVSEAATYLAFSTTPSSGVQNTPLSSIIVQARVTSGSVDVTYSGAVTLSIASGPGGTISGTLTVNAINGVATFTGIQISSPGTYTLLAQASGLTDATSPSILITLQPVLVELVVPKYIAAKTTSSTNVDRTPIAICVQIDNLVPNTTYDMRAGIDSITSAPAYGAGNIWIGAAFAGNSITGAFTTNALGSSGPVWFFAQAATSRFDPGMQHNIRIGYAVTGAGLPTSPNFIGSKIITSLDVTASVSGQSTTTTDDGAFIKGTASTCLSGKFVLLYDNTAGTGDPLYAYQIRTTTPTAGNVTGLPTSIGEVFAQNGASTIGNYAAVIPIGANNPNGVQRIEARDISNGIVSFQTDADGVWPSGANTATITRRSIANITLTDAPLNTLSVTTSTTPETCTAASNGTATANATGTGTLLYSWNTSPVQTTATITGLSSGTYIVTVTDGGGCSVSASAIVGQPAASTITPGGPTTFCAGGSVTLTAGSGVSYLWSPNGETTQSIVVTASGSYSVTVDNGLGCIQTSLPTVVTVNTFSFSGTLYSESMGTPTGTTAISTNVFQNTAPISYSSTSSTVTDVRITNASTGTGSSGGGNIFFGASVAAPTRNFIISGINTNGSSGMVLSFYLKRDNASTDLMTLEASTDGGTNWSFLSFTNPISSSTAWTLITINTGIPQASNLKLRFSKTSNAGQFRLDDVKITSASNSVVASASGSTTLCPGASVILSSNIPTSNTWSPGGQTTQSITVSASGSYTVTAIGTNGCSATSAPINVQTVTNPAVTITSTNVSCFGGNNGTAAANVTDGTSPFLYSWNTAPVQTTPSISSLVAGPYIVSVSDANGCTGSATTTITQPTVLAATSSATTITCNGGSSTVTVSATGGTAPYSGTGSFTVTVGSYSYTVTDANGCTASTSITVTEPSPIVVTITPVITPCTGGTGTVSVSATGGTSPYGGTGTFTVSAGLVSYTVTDANGCTGSASTTIVANPNPTATVSPTSLALCNDGSNSPSNLIVTTSETNIIWNDPSMTTGSTLAVSYLGGAFTYTATVTNSFGCTTTVSVPVTIVSCSSGITLTTTTFIEGYSIGSANYGSTGGLMDNGGLGGLLYFMGMSADPLDVDDMQVSLMDPTTFAEVATASGILKTDGTIIVSFPSMTSGSYYIKLNQRNSIETWSAAPVSMGSVASYNFSTSASQAYGDNMTEVYPGVWAMYSGDISDANNLGLGYGYQDGIIESQDYSDMELSNYFNDAGYVPGDLTGDGIVESSDYQIMEGNNYFNRALIRPF